MYMIVRLDWSYLSPPHNFYVMELAGSIARAELCPAAGEGQETFCLTVVSNQRTDPIPLNQGSFSHTR